MKKKWSDFYSTEEKLVADMMLTKSNPNEHYYYQLVKGYEYIESFKRYYKKNGHLTEKQMTQLKRLASNIYENVNK